MHYLRICAPTIPLVHLAYLRGSTYDALGFPAYGSVFYQRAAEFDPANASIGVIALRSLDSTNSANAVRYAEKIVASPLPFAPAVLAMCALMVLRRDEAEDRPIDRQRFSTLLNDAVERLQLEPPSDAARAMAYQLAASGFEIIDDLPAALACYDEGLKLSPDNDVLLAGKGLLLYGSQTDQAVAAFKRAARNRTSLVWPYFFLAHHSVLVISSSYPGLFMVPGETCAQCCSRIRKNSGVTHVHGPALERAAKSARGGLRSQLRDAFAFPTRSATAHGGIMNVFRPVS